MLSLPPKTIYPQKGLKTIETVVVFFLALTILAVGLSYFYQVQSSAYETAIISASSTIRANMLLVHSQARALALSRRGVVRLKLSGLNKVVPIQVNQVLQPEATPKGIGVVISASFSEHFAVQYHVSSIYRTATLRLPGKVRTGCEVVYQEERFTGVIDLRTDTTGC